MPYNNNIPLGPDRFYVSQGDMLQNFQQTFTDTQVDHVVLNNVDQGKHKFVRFPDDTINPEIAIESPVANIPQLSNKSDFTNTNVVPNTQHCSIQIFEKVSPYNSVDPFRFNFIFLEAESVSSFKLPSGLLVKMYKGISFTPRTQPGLVTHIALNLLGLRFTQILWAQAFFNNGNGDDDVDINVWPYLESISVIEAIVRFRPRTTTGDFTSIPVNRIPQISLIVFGVPES